MINSVLIASGPTIEPIDPVMFISNHSSGKTGYYIAEEAKKRDVERIIYITGPSNYIPDNV
ncbi:MAG: bifunctional 4'-phosphopantothenoylcysteine decarboxylase/phosphopantothenoylcysteine synthetase, partial [Candidatus Aminicenantes bacterium]|nr:bifunctional 4'-phosphopantothenoylcysteine decarboxylase/phosphopantothenoylcysteine synthetase [Candidatus Aminicenantes bacterium]